jgi:hypothetical protein
MAGTTINLKSRMDTEDKLERFRRLRKMAIYGATVFEVITVVMVLPLVIDSTGNGMGYVFFLSMNIFAPAIFLLQFTGLGAYLQTNFALVVLIVSLFLNPLIGSVLFVGLLVAFQGSFELCLTL